jgi:serine/threonine-protein kinase
MVPRIEGYRDLVEIGRGGTGTVYSATQTSLERKVALKVFGRALTASDAAVRFEQECRALGTLNDLEGVVAVHGTALTTDGRPVLVMRLMAASLAQRLREGGPLSREELSAVARSVARALAGAHSRGVVHFDVKPENILVSGRGEIELGDFDISTPARTVRGSLMPLSPAHAAPERFDPVPRSPDARADVWSFGSTLFTLATGQTPFGSARDAGGLDALIDRVRHDPIGPLRRSDLSSLEQVIRTCLEKDPLRRYRDGAAVLAALEGGDERVEGSEGDSSAPRLLALEEDPKRSGTRLAPGELDRRTRGDTRIEWQVWAIAAGMILVIAVVLVILAS